MPAISRDEVAHLARLSRLALTDAELEEFTGQIDGIIQHVQAVQQVAAATSSLEPPVVGVMRDAVADVTAEQALTRRPPSRSSVSRSRRSWARRSDHGNLRTATDI